MAHFVEDQMGGVGGSDGVNVLEIKGKNPLAWCSQRQKEHRERPNERGTVFYRRFQCSLFSSTYPRFYFGKNGCVLKKIFPSLRDF